MLVPSFSVDLMCLCCSPACSEQGLDMPSAVGQVSVPIVDALILGMLCMGARSSSPGKFIAGSGLNPEP